MIRRPLFRDHRNAAALGLVLLAAGAVCLYDAWEGRGGKTPALLRPFLPV